MCFTKEISACLIRNYREARGWTQQQLADRIGMSKSQVGDCENLRYGKISLTTAKRFADVFGCTIDDLFEWAEVPDESHTGEDSAE